MTTMDEAYGDGTDCECCDACGMCKPCGDCAKYGCGARVSLPHDYTRCHGQYCDRRRECDRYLSIADMGSHTSQVERYCEVGRESEGFIAVRDDITTEA